jgi:hypothetical protein
MLVLRGEMAESHRLPDRREGIPVHRQTRRHHAHAQGLTPRRSCGFSRARL